MLTKNGTRLSIAERIARNIVSIPRPQVSIQPPISNWLADRKVSLFKHLETTHTLVPIANLYNNINEVNLFALKPIFAKQQARNVLTNEMGINERTVNGKWSDLKRTV